MNDLANRIANLPPEARALFEAKLRQKAAARQSAELTSFWRSGAFGTERAVMGVENHPRLPCFSAQRTGLREQPDSRGDSRELVHKFVREE